MVKKMSTGLAPLWKYGDKETKNTKIVQTSYIWDFLDVRLVIEERKHKKATRTPYRFSLPNVKCINIASQAFNLLTLSALRSSLFTSTTLSSN